MARIARNVAIEKTPLFEGVTHLMIDRDTIDFHYRHERNHQGIDNKIIEPGPEIGVSVGKIERVDRLGGLLRYYRRVAA